MTFRPYLAFAGHCRQAFTRYQEIFGGELQLLTMGDMPATAGEAPAESSPDGIMHATLDSPVGLLLGADDPSGGFDGQVRGMCVNVVLDGPGDARRVFDALAADGQVQLPLGETFFSRAFGMCIDRFGTPWMVTVEDQEA
jgi:PhnB protein